MKKRVIELFMACMLLVCFFLLSKQAAQVSSEAGNEEKTHGNVIVIDPGHGGRDPGVVGIDKLEEKEINLAVSQKLKSALEEAGYKVVMTRKEDVGLYDEDTHNRKAQDMQRRIARIKEVNPVLTVSIHQNSYQDPSVSGPQVFYYRDSADGRKLAEILQEKLNTALMGGGSRAPKGNTSYYLLRRSPGTLVIVECGFLTNPEEAALLRTEEYQEKVARAVADGILAYTAQK